MANDARSSHPRPLAIRNLRPVAGTANQDTPLPDKSTRQAGSIANVDQLLEQKRIRLGAPQGSGSGCLIHRVRQNLMSLSRSQ